MTAERRPDRAGSTWCSEQGGGRKEAQNDLFPSISLVQNAAGAVSSLLSADQSEVEVRVVSLCLEEYRMLAVWRVQQLVSLFLHPNKEAGSTRWTLVL